MKKVILFLLVACYMLMTTGVVTVSHYCMNQLASVSFFATSEKRCGKCGMTKEKHSCCNDEETLVKLDTGHYKASQYLYEPIYTANTAVFITDFSLTPLFNSNLRPTGYCAPPPDEDIYLVNNVFRI